MTVNTLEKKDRLKTVDCKNLIFCLLYNMLNFPPPPPHTHTHTHTLLPSLRKQAHPHSLTMQAWVSGLVSVRSKCKTARPRKSSGIWWTQTQGESHKSQVQQNLSICQRLKGVPPLIPLLMCISKTIILWIQIHHPGQYSLDGMHDSPICFHQTGPEWQRTCHLSPIKILKWLVKELVCITRSISILYTEQQTELWPGSSIAS